jgi:meso-butanediol dehydrogenase / (S,S)-butanediol dehydrogenase / diacetyl reductase
LPQPATVFMVIVIDRLSSTYVISLPIDRVDGQFGPISIIISGSSEADLRFENKTVVVTGGASGIGLATVRRFHAEGANVVIAGRNGDAAERIAQELGQHRCFAAAVDVSDYDAVDALMRRAVDRFGSLDVVVNNAGVASFGAAPDVSIEAWREVIDVDLGGVFHGCKAAIPLMRRQGGGVLVNTASASGLAGEYGAVAYSAAKAGVINFTRAAALDHAEEGIRVNAVCPGPIDTPLIAGVSAIPAMEAQWLACIPMGRLGRPEEIAAVIAFLASDDASFMTGAAVSVDGGLMAHTGQPNAPKLLRDVPLA